MEKDIRRLVQLQGRDDYEFDDAGSMAPSSLTMVAKFTWQPSRWGASPFYTSMLRLFAHSEIFSNDVVSPSFNITPARFGLFNLGTDDTSVLMAPAK